MSTSVAVRSRTQLFTSRLPIVIVVTTLLATVAISALTTGLSLGWVFVWFILAYPISTYIVTRMIEGRRQAANRLATALTFLAFVIVMVPLLSLLWTVISRGATRFDWTFLTGDMRLTPQELLGQKNGIVAGGAMHAMVGTLVVTAVASFIAIPLGLFTAIYLVEYGRGRIARSITTMVDVMTGIPSIVAGLFAYALFVLLFGPGTRTGLAGGVALSILMTPVVIRSAEEMLRLVPNELREAAYALGVAKWKTIVKVVLPTSIAGLITGVMLAVARVIGETAPLLITAGLAQVLNANPFSDRMTTLPVYTYYQYVQPGIPTNAGQDRAMSAALMLMIIVAVLFAAGRILAKILKPKGLR